MRSLGNGIYVHRGEWINYWPELGGWMMENNLLVYKTLADAKNAVNKHLDGTHKAEPRVIGEADYDPKTKTWSLKAVEK